MENQCLDFDFLQLNGYRVEETVHESVDISNNGVLLEPVFNSHAISVGGWITKQYGLN